MLKKGKHVNAANQTVFEQFYALAAWLYLGLLYP